MATTVEQISAVTFRVATMRTPYDFTGMFWAWNLPAAGKMFVSLRFALKAWNTRSSI
jgi:hypothetical protein